MDGWMERQTDKNQPFSRFWLHKVTGYILCGVRLDFTRPIYIVKGSKISPIQCIEPHISPWIHQWLRVTVSLMRMEPSDFTSILARWMRVNIYCTLTPTFRAWLSLHPLLSAYPLLGAYSLTTCTYKRMCLLTRVYGMHVPSLRLEN